MYSITGWVDARNEECNNSTTCSNQTVLFTGLQYKKVIEKKVI